MQVCPERQKKKSVIINPIYSEHSHLFDTYLVRAAVTVLSILSFAIAGRLSSLAAISLYAASFILSLNVAIISSVFFSNSCNNCENQ